MIGKEQAFSDPIRMEILAGARSHEHLVQLRGLLARYTHMQTTPSDYELAGVLYQRCRANDETVRKLIDCLIAAISIRSDLPLLHVDMDFVVLELHTKFKVKR